MESTIPNNVFMFILFSIFNTVVSLKIPPVFLNYSKWLFKEREWEDGGAVYQRVFQVKHWKKTLPELSDFIKTVFPKKKITSLDEDYLKRYVAESCRSELVHWGIILSSFLFGLWNDFIKTAMMILIALGLNLPYVIIQRYNRPRLISFLTQSDRKGGNKIVKTSFSADDRNANLST